jgi:hypothetical protein
MFKSHFVPPVLETLRFLRQQSISGDKRQDFVLCKSLRYRKLLAIKLRRRRFMAEVAYEGACFNVGDEFLCQACKKQSELSAYVAAHWREGIVYKCSACGTKTTFLEGQVQYIVPAPGKAV